MREAGVRSREPPICTGNVHSPPCPVTSLPSAGTVWGLGGPEFKSRRPMHAKARQLRGFLVSARAGRSQSPAPDPRPVSVGPNGMASR
jgi:hypothetical protein